MANVFLFLFRCGIPQSPSPQLVDLGVFGALTPLPQMANTPNKNSILKPWRQSRWFGDTCTSTCVRRLIDVGLINGAVLFCNEYRLHRARSACCRCGRRPSDRTCRLRDRFQCAVASGSVTNTDHVTAAGCGGGGGSRGGHTRRRLDRKPLTRRQDWSHAARQTSLTPHCRDRMNRRLWKTRTIGFLP